MECACPEGFGITTAINTLASAVAQCLTEEELELAACLFTQLGDTLATIATYRASCGKNESAQTV